MRDEVTAAVALLATLTLLSCTSESRRPELAATNDSALPLWTLEHEPTARISDQGSIMLDGATDGVLLEDGFAVANQGLSQILFLTFDGALRLTRGRQGDGPGEYRRITDIARHRDQGVVIWDDKLSRVTVLSSRSGDVVGTFRYSPALGSLASVHLIGTVADLLLFEERVTDAMLDDSTSFEERRDSVTFQLVRMSDHGVVRTWKMPGQELFFARRANVWGSEPIILGRDVFAAASGSAAAIAANDSMTFQLFAGTGSPRMLSLPFTAGRVDSKWIDRMRDSLLAAARANGQASGPTITTSSGVFSVNQLISDLRVDLIQALPAHERAPAFAGLHIDDHNRIWLKRYATEANDVGLWIVLDSTFAPFAELRIPPHLTVMDADEAYVLTHRRDEFDADVVELWAVRSE